MRGSPTPAVSFSWLLSNATGERNPVRGEIDTTTESVEFYVGWKTEAERSRKRPFLLPALRPERPTREQLRDDGRVDRIRALTVAAFRREHRERLKRLASRSNRPEARSV